MIILGILFRYIASDCDAVALIYGADGYAKSAEDAVADVLKAGMDYAKALLWFKLLTAQSTKTCYIELKQGKLPTTGKTFPNRQFTIFLDLVRIMIRMCRV